MKYRLFFCFLAGYYQEKEMFWTGIWGGSLITAVPAAVFFVSADRLLIICMPMRYSDRMRNAIAVLSVAAIASMTALNFGVNVVTYDLNKVDGKLLMPFELLTFRKVLLHFILFTDLSILYMFVLFRLFINIIMFLNSVELNYFIEVMAFLTAFTFKILKADLKWSGPEGAQP